ncbi:FMN-binding glutamate synthase family protein [Candidatus Thioglobus sp.]|nr:FMN-binding glutamate synthase family protein [Candidatus Thioglobus sp.]MDC0904184.1 FMN-binding glutamate synthase family protein [Candidatus Thioglobus sp.]MDC0965539.1 FMN-binding glutamate synthase family protein [Candidatus Thioglobus sp.]MDC1165662.1 FMN-binding glutamate synthase family protein [Candidatus Thioglobus sp.]MDC3265776.1 FMN-binding glutamate synthase family protein [Candidatus Thioglobus sp.]
MPTLFVWLLGIVFAIILVTFVFDISQSKNAILRNYPVVGHFRYLFSNLGEFFRQYFFAMDREEMPFNRAERQWVNRASSDKDNTIAFGSTKNLNIPGSIIFINCPFPMLDSDAVQTRAITIGEGYSKNPYKASSIFNISGMSYGAISKPAVLALSGGAKKANCWMNTGEGGLSPYHLKSGADLVFQIGTAKYGVRNDDGSLNDQKLADIAQYDQVKMFEIKISQGAKPGKGGILPGIKVNTEISKIRGIPKGEDSISPNRHIEVSNTIELLDMINHVRDVTDKPVGFKTVIGDIKWLEALLSEVNKRGAASAPDFITIDGGDGGTGAAPMALMDNVGLPLKEALPLVVDKIIQHGLEDRIKVIASGKMITPSDVAWAICAGADFVTSARGFMFAIGCIQSLKCNKNTCPTGITTNNKRLQKGLNPKNKAAKVANYVDNMTKTVEIIAHSCGVKEVHLLNRTHVRIVQPDGKSISMNELCPLCVEGEAE